MAGERGVAIDIDRVTKVFPIDGKRAVQALTEITLPIRPGEFVSVVGPSGCGKSTLMLMTAGLLAPTTGMIRVAGRALTAPLTDVGIVFQEPFLIPYLSVRENALVHATDAGAPSRVERLAEAIGVGALLDERPHRLSGGERQRAGVVRALSAEPDLILADEPTAFLDHPTGHAVMDLLRSHLGRAALVVVTHDAEMLAGADRVLHLRDGRWEGA